MPYIKQNQRERINDLIDLLAFDINELTGENKVDCSGFLNYCITSLILKVIPARRYWDIALVTGVLENVKQEFYRRYVTPYEDKKISQNGDVYY